jgi:hypothetical protein
MDPGELVLMGALNSVIVQCKPGPGRIDLTLYVPHSARLQVTGGGFPVDISGSFASAVVDTTSGSISYRLPANDDARVALRSALGTVRSTVPLTAVERIGTRSIQGQLGSGSAQVILNSQNGNVTLTPGPSLSAVAKVSTAETRASRSSARVASTDSESGSQKPTLSELVEHRPASIPIRLSRISRCEDPSHQTDDPEQQLGRLCRSDRSDDSV